MLQLQPELEDLREQGVDLYVVAAGQASEIEKFFNQNQLEATVIYDKDYVIAQQYSVRAVPYLLLVDKQGRVAYTKLGWGGNTYEDEIVPLLSALLAE